MAVRYARFRPPVHDAFVSWARGRIGRVRRTLDLACGTGQGSAPWLGLSEQVLGLDLELAMLAAGRRNGKVCEGRVCAGRAEALPFPPETFDLVVVSLAFHWLERNRCLAEIARVLRPGGWAVSYDCWFTGSLEDQPHSQSWWREYLTRFPSPPRDRAPLTEGAVLEDAGLELRETGSVPQEMTMTLDDLAGYLCTQTNRLASATDAAALDAAEADARRELVATFGPGPFVARFGGSITSLQRSAETIDAG